MFKSMKKHFLRPLTPRSTLRKDSGLKHLLRGLTLCVAIACVHVLEPSVHAEMVDRIVAVVGHQIILASELEGQVAEYSAAQRLDISDASVRQQLTEELLNSMVNDRLMLIRAERDTSIKADEHDVERQLIHVRFGSKADISGL